MRINRRQLLGGVAAAAFAGPGHAAAAPFPVQFRKANPYESLASAIVPGSDEFTAEKEAMQIASILRRLPDTRWLPLAPGFRGDSPVPARYRQVATDVWEAEYGSSGGSFEDGLARS